MKGVILFLLIGLVAVITSQRSQGATSAMITVNTNLDGGTDGLCSLREAITAANLNLPIDSCLAGTPGDLPGDVIQFAAPSMTIHLLQLGPVENYNQTGDLDILESVVIEGDDTTIWGFDDRVFEVFGGSVTFRNLWITGGNATGYDLGGGIRVSENAVQVTLERVNVMDNVAGYGAGIYSQAPLIIRQSAIFRNQDEGGNQYSGAGISVNNTELTLENSTVSGNQSLEDPDQGGGIRVYGGGVATIRNSTIAENSPSGITVEASAFVHLQDSIVINNAIHECSYGGAGVYISGGHNMLPENGECGMLTETDVVARGPILGPLDFWSGPTLNYLLLPRNAAVDNGSCSSDEVTVDQRGIARPQGKGCDIGAHERDELTSFYFVYLPLALK